MPLSERHKALQALQNDSLYGISISRDSFHSLLLECSRNRDVTGGRKLYSLMVHCDASSDALLGEHLIRLFSACGSLLESNIVFSNIAKPTVYTWHFIISAHASLGEGQKAIELFYDMQDDEIQPDKVTFLCILRTCGMLGVLEQGKSIHEQVLRSGLASDLAIGSTLVDMYAKCDKLDDALAVFNKLSARDVVSWSALIAGFAMHGHGEKALRIYLDMQKDGIEPNEVTFLSILKASASAGDLRDGKIIHMHAIELGFYTVCTIGNTLVDMYARCGSLLEAEGIFNRLLNQNVVSWNAMIAGYAQHGYCKQAIRWFENMQLLCIKPTSQTFISLLAACTHGGRIEDGHRYLKCMLNDYEISPGIEHFNCIIDLLGRAGHLNDAERLLNIMPALPNINGWMSLLTSCSLFGNVDLARRSFEQVVKLDPDTSAGHVLMLNIYADAQMWEDVRKLHESRRSVDVWKKPGQAFLEVSGKLHEFMVGDLTHQEGNGMHLKIRNLHVYLKRAGYVPHSEIIFESTSVRECEDC
eukprot:c24737_g10_i2 orf=530-2113(+)